MAAFCSLIASHELGSVSLRASSQDNGFKEGDTVRRIPFEVMVKGDKVPFYEETLEDAGRFTDQPVLPFNAYGTMALARGEFEANSGSSQVFWLLKVRAHSPQIITMASWQGRPLLC